MAIPLRFQIQFLQDTKKPIPGSAEMGLLETQGRLLQSLRRALPIPLMIFATTRRSKPVDAPHIPWRESMCAVPRKVKAAELRATG
jgi:hypothetical protein